MENISYGELINCQDYAERVLALYKRANGGNVPTDAGTAEMAVREYNKEWRSFKSLYGYSIRGYVQTIVNCIGWEVEA